MEGVEAAMLARSARAAAAVPEMLAAGGCILQEAQAKEIRATFRSDRSTGDLADSIKVSDVKEKGSAQMVEVYPDGKDRHGVRNATKGFVLNYGRKRMEARPWFTAANTKTADAVNAEMRKVWEAKQNDGR